MVFQKVEQNRTADAVIRQVEELILAGVLKPGDRLPAERELAKQFDVSRPILRDALHSLEQRHLIVARHGEGTFVADVMGCVFGDAIADLFRHHAKASADYIEFRREIDSVAAGLAAERATEADRTILTRIFEAMQAAHAADDFTEEATIDVEFHNAVGECTHNIVLMHVLRSCYRLLIDGVFYNRSRIYGYPGARDRLLEQHRRIYEAIMARNPDAARAAASAHMGFVDRAVRETERLGAWEEVAALRLSKMETAPRGRGEGRGTTARRDVRRRRGGGI